MGEACEHYLYDKGYGPTNLTLKHYVTTLFPEPELTIEPEATVRFAATVLPPVGAPEPGVDDPTLIAPLSGAYARVIAARSAIEPDPNHTPPSKPPAPKATAPRRPKGSPPRS
jgi:hypothetical protein